MQRIASKEFLNLPNEIPILDVRSEGEFATGHLPNAISFPIFSDKERAVIGTLYKQEGPKIATKKGLEIVGPKLVEFIEQAETYGVSEFRMYCWRGGMRSQSMATLLESYGFKVNLLKGGYKAYRNYIIEYFSKQLPLKVITGYTGSKKTAFLYLLKAQGAQIVDLEGLANHQGSSFGNQKSKSQPTTEQFQNNLLDEFLKLNLEKSIFVEDESMRIGKVNMPEVFYRQKSNSPHIFLEIDKLERVEFLKEDYKNLSIDQLILATEGISKKLGLELAVEAIECIKTGKGTRAAEIILTYYDRQYHKSILNKKHLIKDHFKIKMGELESLAQKIVLEPDYAV
jgi:tRNA 2-selenouridine synthase